MTLEVKNEVFKARRQNLLNLMTEGVAVIASASLVHKSNDTEFPFRQNSNFRYLTGLNEPDSILVLTKNKHEEKVMLFVRPKDALQEMWAGKRLGPQGAKELTQVTEGYSIEDFDKIIEESLPGHKNLYLHLTEGQEITKRTKEICAKLFHKKRAQEQLPPDTFINVGHLVEKLRLKKDQHEISQMKKAMISTDLAHRAAMAMAAQGKSEKDIHALMTYIFMKDEAQGSAYDNIIAGGDNANILHYINNDQPLNDGELLLIDAGAQLNYYATDITRTFPINGKFSTAQRDVYDVVLASQKAAIELSLPGNTSKTLHNKTSEILTQGMIDLGILKGSVEENVEKANHRKYFPHGTGHWLGLDVHDQNPYIDDESGEAVKFSEGCIFTIEPGLYFPQSAQDIPEQFKGIGIRIEDNILITKDGHENMSSMIPKEISEIEEACKKDYRDFLV